MWKIAPALALGNTVVLKPASVTPLTALMFAELLAEAGLPPGAFNVVPGPGAVIGQAMAEHPGIDKISFTGETETGKSILRAAAGTVKRVSMELGGKSPNVVFADADLDAAAKGAINAHLLRQGRALLGRLAPARRGVRPRRPAWRRSSSARRRWRRAIRSTRRRAWARSSRRSSARTSRATSRAAKQEGAKLVAGGNPASVNGKGAFFEATVFDGVSPSMTIAREEIFGPVLATLTFRDEDEAVAIGNATIYGLAAAVWSRDIKKALRAAKALKAGTVWVNAYNFYDPGLPFGGYKESGFGRERGHYALEEYTQVKSHLGRPDVDGFDASLPIRRSETRCEHMSHLPFASRLSALPNASASPARALGRRRLRALERVHHFHDIAISPDGARVAWSSKVPGRRRATRRLGTIFVGGPARRQAAPPDGGPRRQAAPRATAPSSRPTGGRSRSCPTPPSAGQLQIWRRAGRGRRRRGS